MKKLLSVSYRNWAFNISTLALRVVAGALIIPYGYDKLIHFAEKKSSFMNFMGIGSTLSLSLVIFAEFFCSMFIVLGLFTRLAVIPLLISTGVVLFKADHGNIFGKNEAAAFFFTVFFSIFLLGPGKASADGLINK
ncbi:MAG: DoxX family protein [Bacteroidota bacterium]